MNSGQYYELTAKNGATACGSVFGSGSKQNPFVNSKGGFAHPIGTNATPFNNADTTPPTASAHFQLCAWDVVATDSNAEATGINSVWFLQNSAPDSSYNVTFASLPGSISGASTYSFTVEVQNVLLPARAVVAIRDDAGNELDTVFTYNPALLHTSPVVLNANNVSKGASISDTIMLVNTDTVNSSEIDNLSLSKGTQWKIVSTLPLPPLQLAPGDTITVIVRYTAPDTNAFVVSFDTLLLAKCGKETQITTMVGATDSTFLPVNEYGSQIPSEITLNQNYPNPFSSLTTFSFNAPIQQRYEIILFNSIGERIAVLTANETASGSYAAEWNGSGWPSGVYYYEVLQPSQLSQTPRMKQFVLMK